MHVYERGVWINVCFCDVSLALQGAIFFSSKCHIITFEVGLIESLFSQLNAILHSKIGLIRSSAWDTY